MSTQRILRAALSGAEGVGKTALCNVLVGKTFPADYDTTIGVDFFSLRFNDANRIIFWDLGGNRRFQGITNAYIAKSDIIILIYDTTNCSSVNHLEVLIEDYSIAKWLDRIIIVGNKKDKVIDKSRPDSDIILGNSSVPLAQQLADKLKAPHVLVSAKSGSGVDNIINVAISLGRDIIPYQQLERPLPGYRLSMDNNRDCCDGTLTPCVRAREGFCEIV